MSVSHEQIRWFRMRRSGLVDPFASPEAAAGALVGVQAQILPAAGLALWNRTGGLTYAEFDRRLHQTRSLVKLWGQRGTLHLYPSREWPLVYAMLDGRHQWWHRHAADHLGDDYVAVVDRVTDLLRRVGTMGRSDLRAAYPDLNDALFSSWGGLFAILVQRGDACHAGQAGNEGRFAHREYWLPDLHWDPPPAAVANAEIARRYLRAYGPATVQDLAYWRGAPAGDTRAWIASLGDEVVEVEAAGRPMLALRADLETLAETPPPPEMWPIRMLYRFDPLLLGHKDKTWIVDPAHYGQVWRPAGHVEGTLLEHGHVAGTWRYDRRGGGLVVSALPFAPPATRLQAAVEAGAAGVASFFGLPLTDVTIGGEF